MIPKPLMKYMHYKSIGGKDNLETFIEDVKVFIEITFTYFIFRDTRKNPLKEEFTDDELWEDRNECIKCWIGYKGSHIEADRYYSAINYITGYH